MIGNVAVQRKKDAGCQKDQPQDGGLPEVLAKRPKKPLHNTAVYVRQHWQLYLLFLMPAFLLTIIFRYIPMEVSAAALSPAP